MICGSLVCGYNQAKGHYCSTSSPNILIVKDFILCPSYSQPCINIFTIAFGDNHYLSIVWRIMQLKEEACLLVPLLVIGLKVWHLREESCFYHEVAFQIAMESLP
jgi:hypothetical protein